MAIVVNDTPLYIKEVLYQADFGGTKPVFIRASDECEYLLKFRVSDQGKDASLFNEFLGYYLDEKLGYRVSPQNVSILEIDDVGMAILQSAHRNGRIDNDAMGYAIQSLGSNLVVAKLHNVVKADNITNKAFSKKVKQIDNLIMNRDRYKENPNVLKKLDGAQLYAIDYGLGMLESRVHEALENGKYETYALNLQQCDISKDTRYLFKDCGNVKKVDPNQIRDIILEAIDMMPREWEPVKYRDEIADLVSMRAAADLTKNGNCPFELF